MAKPPPQFSDDFLALSQTVHTMNGTLDMLVKVVWVAIAFGVAAAAGLSYQASDMKQQVGKIQGSIEAGTIGTTLKEIKELLERRPPPVAPSLEKQGSLDVLPAQLGRWTGVRADTTDDLAAALGKSPKTIGPVWVYTDDAAAAEALVKAMKP